MASYTELGELFNNHILEGRVVTATWIAAIGVQEDQTPPNNQTQRLEWANSVFKNPEAWGKRMLIALLTANKDFTKDQIEQASDSAIQTRVNAKVDDFAAGVF